MFFRKYKKKIAELEYSLAKAKTRELELNAKLAVLCDSSTENSEEAFLIKHAYQIRKKQDEMLLYGSDVFEPVSFNGFLEKEPKA